MSFAKAINDALEVAMARDPNVICYGLGTDDPKGVFGTTLGLKERFGEARVFDMPTSENAMTGVAIGCALNGIRPVMSHQRLDFFLLSLDQVVNNAAKWFYMFDGRRPVPITIRLIIGRGWGQGPTHSQNLQAWFAHVPGLKVVMPTTPADAKGLLLSSIFDDNPVLFLEHRWLHEMEGEVPEGDCRVPLGKAKMVLTGSDVTLVGMSYMTVEAIHAAEHLVAQGVSPEIVDLRSISPLDWELVYTSVRKTGRIIVLDTANETGSMAGEIIARVSRECFASLKCPPVRICLPDFPSPTSPALAAGFYRRAEDIVQEVGIMLSKPLSTADLAAQRTSPHDVPGPWFKGPF
jgi:pyruvate/2-oxoglutarate/acetoin dehydrogenase E1 component